MKKSCLKEGDSLVFMDKGKHFNPSKNNRNKQKRRDSQVC